MIVKNRDFKCMIQEKTFDKLLKDELFETLKIDQTSQEYLLQRIKEISEKILLEETSIILKNSSNQYTALRNQYQNLETIYQEKSQEASHLELKLQSINDEIDSLSAKNASLCDKLVLYETKLKENARIFDKREFQLLEIINKTRDENCDLKQKNSESIFIHEKLLKELNFLNLSFETDLEHSNSNFFQEDLMHLLSKLIDNTKAWKGKYESINENLLKEVDTISLQKENEYNQWKTQTEKLKFQWESSRKKENDELMNEIMLLKDKNQRLISKIDIIKGNYTENEGAKDEMLQKFRHQLEFYNKKTIYSENLLRQSLSLLLQMKEFLKFILHTNQSFFQQVMKSNCNRIKDYALQKISDLQKKNNQKNLFYEENLAKIKTYYMEGSETLKKQSLDSEQVFLKEKNAILQEKEVLMRKLEEKNQEKEVLLRRLEEKNQGYNERRKLMDENQGLYQEKESLLRRLEEKNEEKESFAKKIEERNLFFQEKETSFRRLEEKNYELFKKIEEKNSIIQEKEVIIKELQEKNTRIFQENDNILQELKENNQINKENNPYIKKLPEKSQNLYNEKDSHLRKIDQNVYLEKDSFRRKLQEKPNEKEISSKKLENEKDLLYNKLENKNKGLLIKIFDLEQENLLLRQREDEKLTELVGFEEKIEGIRCEIAGLQETHFQEKNLILEEVKSKYKNEVDFLRKKLFESERLFGKISEMNIFDNTVSIEGKLKGLKRGLEEFEDFTNWGYDDKLKREKEENNMKTKRLSLDIYNKKAIGF